MRIRGYLFCFPLAIAVLLVSAADASARVRLFIRPWRPLPLIVAPIIPPPVFVPPAPPVGPPRGYVDTDVRPRDARVFVDGEERGIANAFDGAPNYLEVLPGRHRIEFAKPGFEPVSVIVFIDPGEVVSVDLDLRPVPEATAPPESRTYQLEREGTGYVELDVEPSDAAVYIDDVFYGPVSQFKDAGHKIMLRAGTHTVEIGRPGYVLYRGSFTVSAEETTRLEVTLEK